MQTLLTIAAFASIAAFSAIIACVVAGARYDRARDNAWRDHKPRPLRASEIGEPVHGSASTMGSRSARPGNRSNNSGSRT